MGRAREGCDLRDVGAPRCGGDRVKAQHGVEEVVRGRFGALGLGEVVVGEVDGAGEEGGEGDGGAEGVLNVLLDFEDFAEGDGEGDGGFGWGVFEHGSSG